MSYYRFFASDKEMPEYDNADASPVFEGDNMVAIRFNKCSDERTAMRIVSYSSVHNVCNSFSLT